MVVSHFLIVEIPVSNDVSVDLNSWPLVVASLPKGELGILH